MDDDLKTLTREALALPADERARLVEALLDSLDMADSDTDAAWAAVAEDRLDEYLAGTSRTIAAEDVLSKHLKP